MRVVHRIGGRTTAKGVVAAAVRVTGLDLDDRRALLEQDLQLLDRQLGVGERDVRREEHAVFCREADLFVHPPVERPDVGVERLDVVDELVLDVVGLRGEHQRSVDALLVHQRQPQVAAPARLVLMAELGDERDPVLVTEPLQRVQPVQQHPGHDSAGRRAVVGIRHVAEHALELLASRT